MDDPELPPHLTKFRFLPPTLSVQLPSEALSNPQSSRNWKLRLFNHYESNRVSQVMTPMSLRSAVSSAVFDADPLSSSYPY